MKLEKLLLACSGLLSRHALFCLLTLLILLGLTLGLWWVHPAAASKNSDGSTRGSSTSTLCAHASVAFNPSLSVQPCAACFAQKTRISSMARTNLMNISCAFPAAPLLRRPCNRCRHMPK